MRKINHSIRELGLVVAGFAAALLLLESGGLASWANHLEIGPLRSVALPAATAMQQTLKPLGLSAIRTGALLNLARVGWSDDPALIAAAALPGDLPHSPMSGSPAVPVEAASTLPASKPRPVAPSAFPNAPGAEAPLLSEVPLTTALTPLPPVAPGRPRVVALAGDSMMAVGISATLLRQTSANKNLRVVKAFRSGTGLARPEVFNWMDEYPAMVGAEKPEVVIVAIGANDGQGFVVDGKVLAYGTEDWRKVYQDRLASFLAMVSSGGARVVWVGLPPMRVPVYDEKMAAINRIAYTVVSQCPQATWLSLTPYVSDQSGKFREFVTLPNGKALRIRATDGIHLSDEGAEPLSAALVKWLDPQALPAAVTKAADTTVFTEAF